MMRKTKLLSSFLVALSLSVTTVMTIAPSDADASVSVALSLDDVAKTSTLAARVVPRAQTSAWEDGRIVTTTRVAVERVLGGRGVPSEIDVKTLGGRVGNIGQIVEGEASFAIGTSSIVLLVPRASDGALFVNGRAQGQLVIQRAKDNREIVRVASTGALVDRRRARTEELVTAFDGRDAEDASREIVRAWERTHAR